MSEAGVKVSSLLVVLQKCTGRPPGGSAVLLIEVADQFNQKVCEKYVLTIFNPYGPHKLFHLIEICSSLIFMHHRDWITLSTFRLCSCGTY